MATLNILFDASTAKRFPVYAQYPGQHSPQPAYLELDIRDGSLVADYSGEIGNAVPSAVWHNLVLRFKLASETTAGQIEKIISDNKELFQSILDGSESVWDGSNWVGKFSEAAQESIASINEGDAFMFDLEGGMIDLAQWIEDNPFPSAGQTVEEFAQGVIDSDGQHDYYFREIPNIDSMLSDLRDIWADMLYSGKDIPAIVAKHLIEHGTCDDSQWIDELREFASIKYSEKRVGFTSAMKLGFVFCSDSESLNSPNHVYTEFKASENAVDLIEQLNDSQVMTVKIGNEIVVLSVDEAKTLGLSEVTLKVIDKNTARARWSEMNIQNYVEEFLDGASTQFLQEIVDHGIYNTGADVLHGSSDTEYATIAAEFEQQAQAKLGN